MAKTKVYFWLKIDKKFFDNIFIKRLKTIPGGYTMTVIYIRLMLESLESDCILYYEGYFDNLKEELALKLDVSEEDIDMTMAYFTKCGLIQIDEDKNAEMQQAKAMVESETNWANYKREQRKKVKLEEVQPSLTFSNSCPTEKEKETEKENILSGKPDYVFPNWLTQNMIDEIKKGNPENFLLRTPLAYLNHTINKNYKYVDKNLKPIKARFNEGYTLDDFKQVIDNKVADWINNPEFSKYLRPETLFGTKFDSYLNQTSQPSQELIEDNMEPLPF